MCCRACRGEHRSPANLALHPPSGHGRALTKRPRAHTVRPYNVLFISFLCCRACRGEHRSPANLALHPPSGHGRALTKRPWPRTDQTPTGAHCAPLQRAFYGLPLQKTTPRKATTTLRSVSNYAIQITPPSAARRCTTTAGGWPHFPQRG